MAGSIFFWLGFLTRLTINFGPKKIRRCTIKDGNTVLLDLKPVRVGTTGYMYDSVSGVLFANAGTGEFILGPDK